MKKLKIAILVFCGVLVVCAGVALVCYPFISNYLMEQNQTSEIASAENAAASADEALVSQQLEKAREYNESLLGSVVLTDPFDPGFVEEKDEDYESLLNLGGDGIMATVEIPKINVKLPVFHGTGSSVLERGAGHLQKTSLPVGGESTHAVLTGHTGLSSARLFTDLEQLEIGDVFFINVLNQRLAYEVDSIEVVLPSETDSLRVVPGKDYVTLITCTPYGKNTHRLLVRGERCEYSEAEKKAAETETVESVWMQQYRRGLIIGFFALGATLVLFFTIRAAIMRKKRKKQQALEGSNGNE